SDVCSSDLMLKYWVKISLVEDDTISLSEYKATIAGSDIDITDVVMQEKDIDELIKAEKAKNLSTGNKRRRNLDYYKKGTKRKKKKDNRKPRPKRLTRSK